MNILLPILIILLEYVIYLPVQAPKIYPKPQAKIAPVIETPKAQRVEKEVQKIVVKAKINEIPTSADKVVTIKEDNSHILKLSDFAFSDKDSSDVLTSIKITKLQTRGSLKYLKAKKWKKVTLNQEILKEDLEAKRLKFKPYANKYGKKYTSFSFRVSDSKDYSKTSNTITYKVTPVNDIPTASSKTIALVEGSSKTVLSSHFRFRDVESGDKYKNIKIIKIAGKGSLESLKNGKWVKVKDTQEISKTEIDAKKLRFKTDSLGYAKTYASFTFKISDGKNYSDRANKITYRVTQDMTKIFVNGERVYTKECRLCHGSTQDIVKKYKSSKLQKMLNNSVTLSEVHDKTKVSSRTHKYFQSAEYKKELSDIKYYILNP
jgi:hypothetical protein